MSTKQLRYESMVRALSADVYRYALYLCRNPTQAEDLTQETFLRAWRFLSSLQDDSKAKSWLFTTVRREFARQFERYQPLFEEIDPERTPGGTDVDADALTIRKAIATLPFKYREVLLLQAIGGYSGNEISQMLDIPRATVNTRLFRARAHLRRLLDDDGERTQDTVKLL
jgi:RNA polymerase sigma-70 factor (ECF subfamily)